MQKIILIGHVDAGKSTVAGRLLVELGVIDQHSFESLRGKAIRDGKETQVYSRVLDIFEEEQERGKTHEYNEIVFSLNDNEFLLVDTPGHSSFVRSMIAGLLTKSFDSCALVVVSMILNEFESSFNNGMLKEHLTLAKATGINKIIIVANKMTSAFVNWNRELIGSQVKQIMIFLTKTLDWSKDDISIAFTDAISGHGISSHRDCPDWATKKPCLVDQISSLPGNLTQSPRQTHSETPPKPEKNFTIDITVMGQGIIITKMFRCIMHYASIAPDGSQIGSETQVTVINLPSGRPFIKAPCKCLVSIAIADAILISNPKVILRLNDVTVGCGLLISD